MENNFKSIVQKKFLKADSFWIGFISAIIVPIITLTITYFYTFTNYNVEEFFHFLITFRVMTKLFSLCVLPNLGLFFLYLWPEFNKAAKGVVASTFLVALVIIVIQVAIGAF
jgi:hypothetical protein